MALGSNELISARSIPFDIGIPGGPGGPLQPPGGPFPPIGGIVGGGACPPGTRCVGLSTDVFGQTICLGTCAVGGGTDPFGPPGGGGTDFCGPRLAQTCLENDRLSSRIVGQCNDCSFQIGPFAGGGGGGGGGFPLQGGNGNGCGCKTPTGRVGQQCPCCLPTGGIGRKNKSRYYQFGDCRRGTSPRVVEAGSKCVSARRMDFGNIKAAARAGRRVTGSIRHLKRLEKAIRKAAGPARRR